MSDIFVSYKAEDRARVRPLVDALQADGLDIWWDAHIGAGEDWRDSIAANLDKARCVIVVWSKRSVGPDGRFVRDEAARAVKRNAYLPITIDKVEPPLGFGETQCLPLAGWKGSRDDPRYLALLDAARHAGGGRPVAVRAAPAASREGVDRRLVLAGGGAVAVAAAGGLGWYALNGTGANAKSVAVMPFANLSGDPAQAYFSDGLAEELRSALARISGLKVIGRTSSEAVRNADAETAAKKLDVGSILTGSVRRSPSTIRVSAQLVDGRDGSEKWSQTFDQPNGDALKIQTDIAEAVVEQLRNTLGDQDKAAITLGGTSNSQAQDMVLKADAIVTGSRDAYQTQLSLYDAAATLDPNYAAAWAGKSRALTLMVSYYGRSIDELNTGIAKGAELARRAIKIAPGFADGHYSLGVNRCNAIDFQTGWAEYEKALASPGCSPATMLKVVNYIVDQGALSRANAVIDRAAEIDPLNPRLTYCRGVVALGARRYEEAARLASDYLKTQPTSAGGLSNLSIAQYFMGQSDAAEVTSQKLPDGHPIKFIVAFLVKLRRNDRAGAQGVLADMRASVGDNGKYQFAEMLAQLGDREGALKELEGAVRLRDPGLTSLPDDLLFDPLRSDPRFQAIVRQLNFPKI